MKNRTRIFSALLACALCLNLAAPVCAEELSPADSSPPAETETTETSDTGQAEETAEPVEETDSAKTAVTESETPAETEAAGSEEAVSSSLFDEDGTYDYVPEFDSDDFSCIGRATVSSNHGDFGSGLVEAEPEIMSSLLDEDEYENYTENLFGEGVSDEADDDSTVSFAPLMLFAASSGSVFISSSGSVPIDSTSTHLYYAGRTVAYCGNAAKRYAVGSMSAYIYTGDDSYSSASGYSNDVAYKLLKAAMLVAPGGALYSTYHDYLFGGSLGKTMTGYYSAYSHMHMVISYLYSGNMYGASASTQAWAKKVISWMYSKITAGDGNQLAVAVDSATLYVANPKGLTCQPYLWISYTPEGKLQITKASQDSASYDFGNAYTCEGAIFGIYSSGSTSSNTVDTDTLVTTVTASVDNGDGTYSTPVTSMEPGTYYVQEIYSPHGYKISEDVKKVTVSGSATVYTTVSDWPMYGIALIAKRDADTGEPVNGAEITLYSDAACTQVVGTAVTGTSTLDGYTDGYAMFKTLRIGSTYYAKETKAPDGYTITDDSAQPVTIGSEWTVIDDQALSNGNTGYGTLNVKLNSQGRFTAYLYNATSAFTNYINTDGNDLVLYCTATGTDGTVTQKTGYFFNEGSGYFYASAYLNQHLGLGNGTYTLSVVAESQNYNSDGTLTGITQKELWTGTCTLSSIENNMSMLNRYELTFTDSAVQPEWAELSEKGSYTPQILMTKKDASTVETLSGAEFLIQSLKVSYGSTTLLNNTDLNTVVTTGEDGTVSYTYPEELTVSTGSFTYCANYDELSDSEKELVDSACSSTVFSSYDDALAAMQATDGYKLLHSSIKVHCTWKWNEMKAPDGYALDGATYTSFSSGYASAAGAWTAKGTQKNNHTCSISIIKQDENGNLLQGVTYALYTTASNGSGSTYDYNGSTYYLISEQQTDENGKVSWEDLPTDDKARYLAVETATISGMSLLTKPIDIGTLPVKSDTKPDTGYSVYDESANTYLIYNVTYTVTDNATFRMPFTGGSGGFATVFAGVTFFCAAAVTYAVSHRNTTNTHNKRSKTR